MMLFIFWMAVLNGSLEVYRDFVLSPVARRTR